MADWFKVYETDLDDPRLQWAMGTNPNCAIVFIFLLCRCCHFKSDTIPWNMDLDFLTMASTLKMSGPVANDALKMLERTEFITISQDKLIVSNWNTRQSDYMNRRDYYKERYKKQKGFHSEKCEITQRRGEEIRGEEKGGTPINGVAKRISLEQELKSINSQLRENESLQVTNELIESSKRLYKRRGEIHSLLGWEVPPNPMESLTVRV